MNKQTKFINAFYELLEEKPLDDITVNEICKKAKVRRQSFYYHFESVYDLIFSIFYDYNLKPNENLEFYKNIEVLQGFLSENISFLRKIINTYASSVVEEFINSYVYKSLKLAEKNKKHSLSDEATKIISRTFSFLIFCKLGKEDFEKIDFKKEIIDSIVKAEKIVSLL